MNALRYIVKPSRRWVGSAVLRLRDSATRRLLCLVLGAWSSSGLAQAPLSTLVFTLGTTARDATSNDWSYVVIGSPSSAVLAGKTFAVFGKPGFPTNAGAFTARGTMARATDATTVNLRLNQSVALGQDLTALNNAFARVIGTNIAGLLRDVPGITGQTLPQRVLTAFQLADANPVFAATLNTFSMGHPGMQLCAGHGFSEALPTTTTYEVREINSLSGSPEQVVGRVTVIPNSPVILPAPGPSYQVMTNDPSDHLLIRLRWGTPPELRRLSLLSFGFNLWRIPRAEAEARDFHHVPPTVAQLYSNSSFTRANVTSAIMARRDMALGAGTGAAEDPNDRITYFFADDGRATTGTNFFDGQEFYYFVTARDLLGRDGLSSDGRLARACRRTAPAPPGDVHVENAVLPNSTNQPRLLVVWEQNTNATDAVSQYWVYRWANATFALTNEPTPLSNRVGVVGQAAGTNRNYFLDTSAGALTSANLSNVWYTVRAVSLASCDPLLSAQAGPAWGVLRERAGPDATTGEVLGSCGTPVVTFQHFTTNSITNDMPVFRLRLSCVRRDPGIAWAMFSVTNVDAVQTLGPLYFPPDGDSLSIDIEQTFQITGPGQIGVSCTVGTDYGQISSSAQCSIATPFSYSEEREAAFFAGQLLATALNSNDPLLSVVNNSNSVCTSASNVSPDASGMVAMQFGVAPGTTLFIQAQTNGIWTDVAVVQPDPNNVYWISYPACLIGPVPPFRGCTVNLPSDSGCAQHITGAADGGPSSPLRARFRLTPRTREYRVYRRADDGPLTLFAQGPAAYDPGNPSKLVEAKDEAMPSSPARLCYFVQLLDEHGNGSPLSFIGCRNAKPPKPARPVLAESQPAGTSLDPQVVLNWFCPTTGISRFQFKIQRVDAPSPSAPSGIVSSAMKLFAAYNKRVSFFGLLKNALAKAFSFSEAQFTPYISPTFGPGPQFTLTANVIANATYDICVTPVDEQGIVLESATSEVWRFKWTPPVQLADVPWPARPLPPVRDFEPDDPNEFFSPRATAQAFVTYYNAITDLYRPIGIRIGTLSTSYSFVTDTNNPFVIYDCWNCGANVDPHAGLFRSRATDAERANRTLLPLVVYRQQVTNANFPKVSGDIVQVTPLIERIPWMASIVFGDGGNGVRVTIPDRLFAMVWDQETYYNILYVLDQQPAVLGARYRYFVLRFNDQREPYDVLPVGEVELPLNPYNGP